MQHVTPRQFPVCCPGARGLLCSFAGSYFAGLNGRRRVQEYRRGQTLFWEGQSANCLHCIRSGRVKKYKTGRGGEQLLLGMAGPGDVVGLNAIVLDEPHDITAEAIEQCTTCLVAKQDLLAAMRARPALVHALLCYLANEVLAIGQKFLSVAHEPVRCRTARLLLSHVNGNSTEEAAPANGAIRLPRSELAALVGASRETCSRVLNDLARRGIVVLHGSTISVTNTSALKRLAGRCSKV